MTIEIRELIVQVQVTESEEAKAVVPFTGYSEWDEQRLLEKMKREIIDYLLERGHL